MPGCRVALSWGKQFHLQAARWQLRLALRSCTHVSSQLHWSGSDALTSNRKHVGAALPLVQVIVALAEKGDMGALQAYTGQTGGTLNYLQVCAWC